MKKLNRGGIILILSITIIKELHDANRHKRHCRAFSRWTQLNQPQITALQTWYQDHNQASDKLKDLISKCRQLLNENLGKKKRQKVVNRLQRSEMALDYLDKGIKEFESQVYFKKIMVTVQGV